MKRIKIGIIGIILSLLFIGNVNAASVKFNVSSSASQVIVGSNVKVYVTVSSSLALGTWEYTLNYDHNLFKVENAGVGLHYAGVANNNTTKSVTYTYVFKALKSGTGRFYVDSSSALSFVSEEVLSPSNGSKSVNTISYAEYQASLSSNNYLKSITVEGQKVTPDFNKETTEYLVQVSEDVKTVKIGASQEDSSASINGTGSFDVSPGLNNFEIVVVAQNGSERTYKLVVEVLDKNPINVKVGEEDLTVVKIASNITMPHSFVSTSVTINGLEIPGFYNEVLDINLVGLKDSKGNIGLYIYKDGTYVKYNEIYSGNLTIYPLDHEESVALFVEDELTIQNNKIKCMKATFDERYYLVYGKNVESGEEGYYLYDVKDQSLIKYDSNIIDDLLKKNELFLIISIIFASIFVISFFAILYMLNKNNKLKKQLKEISDTKNEKEKTNETSRNKKSKKVKSDEIK